jgi:hypothetical protein
LTAADQAKEQRFMPTQAITPMPPQDLTDETLVGSHGGLARVTGEVYLSNTHPGSVVVETEHGSLYLDATDAVEVLAAQAARP